MKSIAQIDHQPADTAFTLNFLSEFGYLHISEVWCKIVLVPYLYSRETTCVNQFVAIATSNKNTNRVWEQTLSDRAWSYYSIFNFSLFSLKNGNTVFTGKINEYPVGKCLIIVLLSFLQDIINILPFWVILLPLKSYKTIIWYGTTFVNSYQWNIWV